MTDWLIVLGGMAGVGAFWAVCYGVGYVVREIRDAFRAEFPGILPPSPEPNVAYCPRCQRKSLQIDPSGRVFCLYAATCGYNS